MEIAFMAGAGFLSIIIMLQRWFWVVFFFILGLVFLFAMIASIVNLKIFWAIGFMFLMVISFSF